MYNLDIDYVEPILRTLWLMQQCKLWRFTSVITLCSDAFVPKRLKRKTHLRGYGKLKLILSIVALAILSGNMLCQIAWSHNDPLFRSKVNYSLQHLQCPQLCLNFSRVIFDGCDRTRSVLEKHLQKLELL